MTMKKYPPTYYTGPPSVSMPRKIYPVPYDPQTLPPYAVCSRCGGEIYDPDVAPDMFGHYFCEQCKEETEQDE